MTTVDEELRNAASELAKVGCETPRLDAELLLARAMDSDRAGVAMRSDEEASSDLRTRYLALLSRRVRHEPVAYILGRKDFRRITLAVDPRVLIPRPETELLVELALTLPPGVRVADVGTGSGAVALAIKEERPDLDVVGSDTTAATLSLARLNAARLRLMVEWTQADLLDGIECDAAVANLPYIATGTELPVDVAEYEPASALFAGPDGLDLIRRLVAQAGPRPRLTMLALEIGFDQSDAVAALVAAAGFGHVERIRDLAGHERVIVGRR